MWRKVGLLVLVLVVAWCLADGVARLSFARALREPWPNGLGSLNDVPARHPPHPTSAAARHRADLGRAVGADLLPQSERGPHDGKTPAQLRLDSLKDTFQKYEDAQLRRADDEIDEPPPVIVQFLADQRVNLDALRRDLLTNRGEWSVDLRHWDEAPVPNLLGHLLLLRILVTSSLIHERGAEHAAAWEDLRCAWELGRSLRDRPELISQLIALAITRMTEAAARKLTLPVPAWHEELATADPRPPIVRAFQAETFGAVTYPVDDMFRETLRGRVFMTLLDPWVRLSSVDSMDVRRALAYDVAKIDACAITGEAIDDRAKARLARWNTIGRAGAPFFATPFARATAYLPEREATLRILELKRRKLAAGGSWPEFAGDLRSSACPDGTWSYQRNADGSMDLRFSNSLRLTAPAKPYPLRFHYARRRPRSRRP